MRGIKRWLRRLIVASVLPLPSPAQVPTPRPEPTATTYDTSELNLLPSYSRASFKAAFGKDAPAFDITRAPKSWFDSTQMCAAGAVARYQVLSGVNIVPLTISTCDAASVNLPPDVQPQFPAVLQVVDDKVRFSGIADLDVYLQNQVYLTESLMLTNGGSPASTGAAVVVTRIDAAKAASQVGSWADYVCQWQQLNDRTFHGGIDPNCSTVSKATLVAKYSGVLRNWAVAAATVQDLMGVVPGTVCKFCIAIAVSPVAMPVRPLYPDEQVRIGSMMGGAIVVRSVTAPSSQGGAFGDADRAALMQVLGILKSITGQ